MRGAGILSVVVMAVAVGLCCGEVLAKSQTPIVATSMVVRPDAMQLQAIVMEWVRATFTSTQFIVGTVIGVIFAEGGRFILRWLARTLSFLTGTIQLVIRYRLIVAAVVAAIAYALTHWVYV